MARRMVVVALILATACGGSAGGERPTVAALAARLGCSGLEMETDGSQRELGAREDGHCMFAGERVQVLVYNSNSARDSSNKIAQQFGGIAVLGDRWTVRVDSDAAAVRVKDALGGDLG